MKKFALALALVLLPASAFPVRPAPPQTAISQTLVLSEKPAARLEQQKSKWAPNGMKMLIIHGRRRWVEGENRLPVEKRKNIPIQKEGV